MVGIAHMKNPKCLIALDLKDERLEKALEFGADLAWNPSKTDVTAEIKKLTDGYGCDIYIEATGHPASVLQGMDMIRKLGTFVEFSVFGKPVTLDWSVIGDQKEIDLLGSHLSPYSFPAVIDWMASGKLPTSGVLGAVLPLEEWERGYERRGHRRGRRVFKVALKP